MERRTRRRVVRKSKKIRKNVFALLTLAMIICLGTFAMGGQTMKTQKVYYESVLIEKGDTLWDIATEYKGEEESTEQMIKKIMEFNQMSLANIRSGERILVPVGV